MRICIIGSSAQHAAEASYARLLRENNCEVLVWDNKTPSRLFGNRSWWNLSRAEKLAYDTWASWRFYRLCLRYKPDVLFMPKAENIHSYAVKRVLEETKARLVVWYPDHPFKADQTSMNILRNLRRCDIFYIWGKFLVDAIRAAGCPRVEYLPFGFDPVLHPPEIEVTTTDLEKYRCDICFVGTWDEEREAALEPLAAFNLSIWGPSWFEKVSASSPLHKCVRGTGLYGIETVKAFKSARVVFNHLRNHNGSAHNMRAMEIAGVNGGVQLVRRTRELARELFCETEDIFCFDGEAELATVATSLVNESFDRKGISEAAAMRVKAMHLLKDRISKILLDLQK